MAKAKSKKNSLSDIETRIQETACALATLCDERRGEEIRVLDVRGICSYADAFVIASAASQPQMKGMVKALEQEMHGRKVKQISRSGLEAGTWVLLDFGDILVHIFDRQTREYYQLDDLYGDAPHLSFELAKKKETPAW